MSVPAAHRPSGSFDAFRLAEGGDQAAAVQLARLIPAPDVPSFVALLIDPYRFIAGGDMTPALFETLARGHELAATERAIAHLDPAPTEGASA